MLSRLGKENDFNSIIKSGTWLVDFSASWCGPCRMLEPVLEEYSKEGNVLQIDVDDCSELARSYGIMSVPTIMCFKDGELIKKDVGYKTLNDIKEFMK